MKPASAEGLKKDNKKADEGFITDKKQ